MARAQIWTSDFIMAALVMAVIMLLFLVGWNSLAIKWNSAQGYREMWVATMFATSALSSTSGSPPSWENGNISDAKSFGLASERSVMSSEKLARLSGLNQSEFAQFKEGLGLTPYKMSIEIRDRWTNTSYFSFGDEVEQLKDEAIFDRLVIYNNSMRVLRVQVWK